MKLRITANKGECIALQKYFETHLSSSVDYSVSELYPCRNSNLFRLYVDVTLHSDSGVFTYDTTTEQPVKRALSSQQLSDDLCKLAAKKGKQPLWK